jgi:hypothetical protein
MRTKLFPRPKFWLFKVAIKEFKAELAAAGEGDMVS